MSGLHPGRAVKPRRKARIERIKERTDRDEIVQHVETVRALPNRRHRKVAKA